MQMEARVGVVVEGGQRALNSAHGGVAVNGTAKIGSAAEVIASAVSDRDSTAASCGRNRRRS